MPKDPRSPSPAHSFGTSSWHLSAELGSPLLGFQGPAGQTQVTPEGSGQGSLGFPPSPNPVHLPPSFWGHHLRELLSEEMTLEGPLP